MRILIQVAHDEQGMGKCQGGEKISLRDSQVSASLMWQIPPIVVDMRIRPYNIKPKLKLP